MAAVILCQAQCLPSQTTLGDRLNKLQGVLLHRTLLLLHMEQSLQHVRCTIIAGLLACKVYRSRTSLRPG